MPPPQQVIIRQVESYPVAPYPVAPYQNYNQPVEPSAQRPVHQDVSNAQQDANPYFQGNLR